MTDKNYATSWRAAERRFSYGLDLAFVGIGMLVSDLVAQRMSGYHPNTASVAMDIAAVGAAIVGGRLMGQGIERQINLELSAMNSQAQKSTVRSTSE